jgi:hypothetical protein
LATTEETSMAAAKRYTANHMKKAFEAGYEAWEAGGVGDLDNAFLSWLDRAKKPYMLTLVFEGEDSERDTSIDGHDNMESAMVSLRHAMDEDNFLSGQVAVNEERL